MDMFVVRGGQPLVGRVAVGGAKNAALPIMAAALAVDGPTVLSGVPDLVDVETLAQVLDALGLSVHRREDEAIVLEPVDPARSVAEYDLVRRMRASVCVLGPMLARRGQACVSLPGGCNIGDRPIDLHLKGLRALGADIRVERGYVIAEARRLRGASIYLGGPFGSTVTGTCNVMTAAALADGRTTIEAAACEPEVVDLGSFLNRAGARISGLGTPFLSIEGVERLQGVEYTIIPDRIEAATLMIAAAATRGRVELENVRLEQLTAVVEKLREIGADVSVRAGRIANPSCGPRDRRSPGDSEDLRSRACPGQETGPQHGTGPQQVVSVSVPGGLRSADCIALPYPGIPTDVQAQLMALLTVADGISLVTDKVFPDRFLHAAELVRMGARIRREGPSAVISGVPRLSGACVMASDLRASAALVIAALVAEGPSVIRRIYHLDRGYERLEDKLARLGADVSRVEDAPANMPAALVPAIVTGVAPVHAGAAQLAGPKWLTRRRSSVAAHASAAGAGSGPSGDE